jgi:5-methylcytosine-specific restriction endonuclease McrA
MDANARKAVRRRAGDRCEYCRLPQAAAPLSVFHIEHIRALQHGGSDLPSNLALACPACNAKKGPNVATVSETGELIELFNPRQQF